MKIAIDIRGLFFKHNYLQEFVMLGISDIDI